MLVQYTIQSQLDTFLTSTDSAFCSVFYNYNNLIFRTAENQGPEQSNRITVTRAKERFDLNIVTYFSVTL